MQELSTTSEVMEALGGKHAVAELTGYPSKAVWNWSKRFPAKTYMVLSGALQAKGLAAPPSLWGMKVAQPSRVNGAA